MGRRTVYGNQWSENGWPMVDGDSCTWTTIPGTNVDLQIQNGWPLIIMRAFAADFHAYVEPLRDADSACWTPTNSVPTSNHLSGTAMDLNWNSHPFRVKDAGFNGAQLRTCRELLAFYEDTIFWGNDWNSPKDAMHWQMGYDTFEQQRVADFIKRKIRGDGYSMFRRDGSADAAAILAQAAGLAPARATAILPMVTNGLRRSDCTTVDRIAMWLAQIGHESAGFKATEEYQSGDESTDRWRYKGRTWIQITWKANYEGFSRWVYANIPGLIPTPNYFVEHPKELADLQWAGLGPAWYWTVARPQINSLCDRRDLEGVTKAINGGLNGLNDRRARYNGALAVGDDLLHILDTSENWTPAMNQLVGGDNPMATADDVNRQLDDPNDKVMLYEGSAFQHLGWTVRDWCRTLAWDLTRFQKPSDARFKANPSGVWGLRDAVTSLQRQVDQNNRLLKKLCDDHGLKYDDLD